MRRCFESIGRLARVERIGGNCRSNFERGDESRENRFDLRSNFDRAHRFRQLGNEYRRERRTGSKFFFKNSKSPLAKRQAMVFKSLPVYFQAFVRDYPTDSSIEEASRERDASPRVDDDKSVVRVLLRSEEQRKKSDVEEEEEAKEEEEEEENEIGAVKKMVSTPPASRPHSRDPPSPGDASIEPLDFRSEAIARPPSGRGNESPKMSSSTAVSSNAIAANVRRDSVTRGKINRPIKTGNEPAIKLVDVNGVQVRCLDLSRKYNRSASMHYADTWICTVGER